jgi:hypothetical protein
MEDNAKLHHVFFKSGFGVWLLRYATLAVFFLCFAMLMLIDIFDKHNLFLLNLTTLIFFGIFLLLLQMCYSWYFPLELIVFKDRLCSIGAWKVRHTMKFRDIKFVKCNDSELFLQRKKIFFNKIYITKLQDPEQKTRKLLMATFEEIRKEELGDAYQIIT